MQTHQDWLSYFERNRARRTLIPWEWGIAVETHLRDPLIRSLQRFQVGEQGDGRHLRTGAAATGDPAYVAAMALFVKEEQEHARLLARLIEGLGGRLLRWHWSDVCFVALRRVAGLRLELMVLLIAEMIAKAYYRAMYDGTRDAVLRMAFAQILCDEVGHVAFHCDYLNRAFAPLAPPARRLARGAWRLMYRIVCLVVTIDHRRVLRAVRVSPGAFWRDCGRIFDDAAARIFNPNPAFEQPKADIKAD
jgi:hypothetical protein